MKTQKSKVKSQNYRGFTLVEVLIALSILGMMVSIILAGMRLGVDAWERGDNISEETQRIRALTSRLSNELGSMYPYIITVFGGTREYAFKGERDRIGFVTANEDSMPDLPKGGFKWVFYAIKEDKGLTASEKMIPDKSILDKPEGRETLIEPEVKGIVFEYMDKEGAWTDTWDAHDKMDMPSAVRIALNLKEGGRYSGRFIFTIPTRMAPRLPKKEGKGIL